MKPKNAIIVFFLAIILICSVYCFQVNRKEKTNGFVISQKVKAEIESLLQFEERESREVPAGHQRSQGKLKTKVPAGHQRSQEKLLSHKTSLPHQSRDKNYYDLIISKGYDKTVKEFLIKSIKEEKQEILKETDSNRDDLFVSNYPDFIKFYNLDHKNFQLCFFEAPVIENPYHKIFLVFQDLGIHVQPIGIRRLFHFYHIYKNNSGKMFVINKSMDIKSNVEKFNDCIRENKLELTNKEVSGYCCFFTFLTFPPQNHSRPLVLKNMEYIKWAINNKIKFDKPLLPGFPQNNKERSFDRKKFKSKAFSILKPFRFKRIYSGNRFSHYQANYFVYCIRTYNFYHYTISVTPDGRIKPTCIKVLTLEN